MKRTDANRSVVACLIALLACSSDEGLPSVPTDGRDSTDELDADMSGGAGVDGFGLETSLAETSTPTTIADTTGDTEIIENRDIYDPVTDTYTDWPHTGPLAEELWRLTPTIDGEDITLNTAGLAVDGNVVYYGSASRQQDTARSFLHAMTSDGEPLWHVETWDMMVPLPIIVDDNGDILLVAQSISLPSRTWNGVRVQKWGKDGVKHWERLGDPVFQDFIFGFDRELASMAAAIDEQNNLYLVTGAFLRSVDGQTGDIRWHHNLVPDGTLSSSREIASPTIVNNLIYMVNDSNDFVVLDNEGNVVIERKALFDGIQPRWLSASRAGFLMASALSSGFVTFTLDGDIIAHEEDGFSEARHIGFGSDDGGIIYVPNLMVHGMRAIRSDLSPVWSSPGWLAWPDTGLIVDTEGRVGFKSRFGYEFSVMDQATGELLFDEHPLAVTYGQPVIARPGEAILVARYPGVDRAHLKCIKVPLGLPVAGAWSTAHANFKNQRRIRTLAEGTR